MRASSGIRESHKFQSRFEHVAALTWKLLSFITTVRMCYPEGCAAPGSVPCQCNTRGLLSKLKKTPPQRKIHVTSKSPVGDISVVTLIRTDTTLDHSQKAEKVCTACKEGVKSFKLNTQVKRFCQSLTCVAKAFCGRTRAEQSSKSWSLAEAHKLSAS